MIKLSRSMLDHQEKEALCRVVDDGYLGMGSEVRHFEDELKHYIDSENPPYVACVSTGTAALHLAVQALNIGPGDEVLVPTLTYVASFQAISATGATAIATDVDALTGCMDLEDAQKRVTKRTKALMPVHYGSGYGQLNELYAFAKRQNLRVIEDAAHSFGGVFNGQKVGASGDVICFSFDGIKNITCGEGGAVVSRDQAVIQKVSDLRLLGVVHDTQQRYQGKRSFDLEVEEQGWRYHMSNLNAAIGRVQLQKIEQFAEKRRHLYKTYLKFLSPDMGKPLQIDIENAVPHPFIFILSRDLQNKNPHDKRFIRDELRQFLQENNIETGLHYKPNHLLKFYAQKTPHPFPVAEDLWDRMITLPLHCHLSDGDVEHICFLIQLFVSNLSKVSGSSTIFSSSSDKKQAS